jgi:hypothetical protein
VLVTLFRRIFREHSGAHLWIPIVVVAVLSVFLDLVPFLWNHNTLDWTLVWKWADFWKPLLVRDYRELLGIYLAFVWVVWKSVRKASDVRWTMIGDLVDKVKDADRYFAIGTIQLKEWFEPNTLLYLATIIREQYQGRKFVHERVLLFHEEADFEALQASYLDQHYAKSFSAIHDRFNIPLAYLRPGEVRQILGALDPKHQCMLSPYRWFARPRKLWRVRIFRALGRKKPSPFAVIYHGDNRQILRFLKSGNSLTVEEIKVESEKLACLALVDSITESIYQRDTLGVLQISERCKFSRYLCP